MRKSDNLPIFTKSDVKLLHRKNALSRFFHWMCIDSASFIQRRNEWRGKARKEIFERGRIHRLTLPFDPRTRDEVVLVEQIRIAAYDTSVTPWLLEMVAGMIRRRRNHCGRSPGGEAMEEAGLTVGRTRPVISYGEVGRNQRALIIPGG